MESGETLLNNHWLGNRGESLSFLVGTISNVSVMEIGLTDKVPHKRLISKLKFYGISDQITN
jgi:hypothetical protein